MSEIENTIELEMRLAAIEYLLCQLWVNIISLGGINEQKFDQATQAMLGQLKRQTFSGLSPEWSDLAAAELEEAVARLIGMQREMLGFPKRKKDDPNR